MNTFHEERIVILPGSKKNKQNVEVWKNDNGKETHFKRNNLTKTQGNKLLKKQFGFNLVKIV